MLLSCFRARGHCLGAGGEEPARETPAPQTAAEGPVLPAETPAPQETREGLEASLILTPFHTNAAGASLRDHADDKEIKNCVVQACIARVE